PHINRDNAADLLELPPDKVRIIQPPVGGSFGGKDDHVYQLTVQAGKLALVTGKPVRLVLNREESLTVSYKREAGRISLKVGFDQEGTILAGKGKFLADSGAYASMTPLSAFRASMHLLGTYRYQAAAVDTDVVYTNNGFSGAFRGFGNTKAAAASEMLIDEAAALFERDPLEYRLDLCLRRGDQAFTGNTIEHQVGLSQALEWVRDRSDWCQLREIFNRQDPNAPKRQGLGVACYFHGSGLGGEGIDYARTTIEIERDHTITLQSGLTDYGQGSRTVFTNVTADVLGVDRKRIIMLRPDTQTALESGPTVASRASIVGGNATRVAAEKVLGTLNLAASSMLGCEMDQIHRQGELFIGPDEDPVSFEEVVNHAFELGLQLFNQGYWQIPEIHWDFESGTGTPYFTYSYGAQVAQVEVDMAEGSVRVERIWAAHDGGKIIFPKGARGQLLGGIAQGLGFALTEGFEFVDGIPKSTRFAKYKIPSILDMPKCETTFIETSLPEGPYGAKNLAEPVMIGTAPAIANGIYHAVGVRCYQLPVRAAWLKDQIQRRG
ncbi:MAG: xanthine dehydrogenase family protein molybdopterin-binding subunit, partial [Anaerolineales bacterium]